MTGLMFFLGVFQIKCVKHCLFPSSFSFSLSLLLPFSIPPSPFPLFHPLQIFPVLPQPDSRWVKPAIFEHYGYFPEEFCIVG